MAPKRKATSPVRPSPSKKRHTDGEDNHAHQAEKAGIIQREFYPPEMDNGRCERYNNNELPRPLELLDKALNETRAERGKIRAGRSVIHWFKRDLRTVDNTSLSLASNQAIEAGVPLVCMYIVSPQDFQAHFTSAARVDFDLRTLEIMKSDLAEKHIPLYVATIENRKDVPGHIMAKAEEWGAKHIFCNIEYEVDELRREAKLVRSCLQKDISFTAVHDDCVVPPENLSSGSGKQYSVYSPWLQAWTKHLHAHPRLLDSQPDISANPASTHSTAPFSSIFDHPFPAAPPNKTLDPEHKDRLAHIFPAGEHEAHARLTLFLQSKITAYKDARNLPAANSTSLLSVHFSAGTLSARTAIRLASKGGKLDDKNSGHGTWISELAWRDFYKHVMCHWPYVCMGKPFKYEYSDIEWEYNDEHFRLWTEGKTGFPIIDAAMRQVQHMSYMHNRCRMIVASFLAKDLLLDWRRGEKWFMENLIDGDFASNNGGWGFSASTGVDPQPYFRIFNPLLQSEKFDPEGEYIRKWVPELRAVKGKAVHAPYERGEGKTAEREGYPKPMVEHKMARERALERYKRGLGRGTANEGGGVHN